MVYVMVQHEISKWSEFEIIFREDAERRKLLGCKGGKVLRNADDPANILVIFEWSNLDKAYEFANGLETHEAMKWATSGIRSEIKVCEEVFEVEF